MCIRDSSSGLICLAVSLIVLAVFSLLFRRKIHWMLCNVSFTSIWRALFAAPLFLTVVFIWITPWSPSVVLTGRVREISVVLLIIFLSDLFWLYYFVYLTTHKMTEAVELQAQNQLLGMETVSYTHLLPTHVALFFARHAARTVAAERLFRRFAKITEDFGAQTAAARGIERHLFEPLFGARGDDLPGLLVLSLIHI